jgi:hypothetical protein
VAYIFFFSADCLFGGSLLKFVAIKTNGIDEVLLSTLHRAGEEATKQKKQRL